MHLHHDEDRQPMIHLRQALSAGGLRRRFAGVRHDALVAAIKLMAGAF
jgi:hypothetical protein